ncbi:MAG: hypothetical protein HY922_13690 [Elusimicrobia bacterium]|nr:hypothetical protein [Elusimicrobiota bacterium]
MNRAIVVALISAACNGAIGTLAYLRGRHNSLYRSFSVLSFSFAFWSLAYIGAWPDFSDPFRMKLLYTPLAWLPGAVLSFVWSFTGLPETARRRRTVPLYLAGAGLLGMLWTRAVSLQTYQYAFLAAAMPIFGIGLVLLFLHWKKADDRAERNRRGYLLAASCIAVAGALADGLSLLGHPIPKPGNLCLMLYSLIVLAAIGRHHLMDLRAATRQALTMAGVSLLLSILLTGIAWLTQLLEGPLFLNFFLLGLVLLALLPALWERFNTLFGRSLSARQARRDRALEELERSLDRASELQSISSMAQSTIRSVWGAEAQFLWAARVLRGLEPGPALQEPLLGLLATAPQVATLDSLGREERTKALYEALLDRQFEAVVPVLREGELVGAALLGPPVGGFYDLSGVRWLNRLSAALGRAVGGAELAAGLLRADRLAQLGTLAAGVAHEVRNPLSAMSGAIALLGQPLGEERRREYLDVLKEEIQRLDGIVAELLDYASPDARQARCSWAEVWGRAERLLRADWPGGVALLCRDEPADLAVSAAHLQQILHNLLRNALCAVQTRRPPAEKPEVLVTLSKQNGRALGSAVPGGQTFSFPGGGGRAVLEVADNGAGIPLDLLPRLFVPFAKASDGGAGLGLATVKRLAELYGGRVWAENLGQGARFTVELPLA